MVKFAVLGVMSQSLAYKTLNCRFALNSNSSKKKHQVSSFVFWCLLLFFLASLLAGCSTTYAPVEQRSSGSYDVKKKYRGKTPTYHKVKKGETLYAIAWKYGQDYKSLAYRNRIKSPYRIYAGDKLRLRSASAVKNNKKNVKKSKVSGKKGRKYYSKAKVKNKQTRASKKRTTSGKTSSKRAVKKNKKNATFKGNKRLSWNWPVKGKIIQRYSPGSGKKGIDISAAKGALIKSAEAGKVVYSGQGLVGYGRLIIIKHNDTYLSAYAHNQSLLVNEGQVVKKGQSIARLGRSGTNRYKLHFEIRKNGKPVNPMSFLPH